MAERMSLEQIKAAKSVVAEKGERATGTEILLGIFALLQTIDYQIYKASKPKDGGY